MSLKSPTIFLHTYCHCTLWHAARDRPIEMLQIYLIRLSAPWALCSYSHQLTNEQAGQPQISLQLAQLISSGKIQPKPVHCCSEKEKKVILFPSPCSPSSN